LWRLPLSCDIFVYLAQSHQFVFYMGHSLFPPSQLLFSFLTPFFYVPLFWILFLSAGFFFWSDGRVFFFRQQPFLWLNGPSTFSELSSFFCSCQVPPTPLHCRFFCSFSPFKVTRPSGVSWVLCHQGVRFSLCDKTIPLCRRPFLWETADCACQEVFVLLSRNFFLFSFLSILRLVCGGLRNFFLRTTLM